MVRIKLDFPKSLKAGLSFDFTWNLTAYPASQGWRVTVLLRGVSAMDLSAQAQGNLHLLSVPASTTATWAGGHYAYSVRAVRDDAVHELDAGVVTIVADLASTTQTDFTSHAQKVLAAIEAVLEQRATIDQERYRINNRELYRTPIETLKKLRDQYRAEVRQEQAKANGKNLFGQVLRYRLQ